MQKILESKDDQQSFCTIRTINVESAFQKSELCSPLSIHGTIKFYVWGSVRPKFSFGIVNQNQGFNFGIGTGAEIFFSKTETYFSNFFSISAS